MVQSRPPLVVGAWCLASLYTILLSKETLAFPKAKLSSNQLLTGGNVKRSLIAVFEKDTRRHIPSERRQLQNYVGRLEGRSGRYRSACTAFCMRSNIIATAAHCLFPPRKSSRKLGLSNFVFRLKKSRKTIKSSRLDGRNRRDIQFSVIAGTTFSKADARRDLSVRMLRNLSNDWALARLSRNICDTPHLRLLPPNFNLWGTAKIFTLGHIGFRKGLRFTDDCSVKSYFGGQGWLWRRISQPLTDPANVIPNDCDLSGGGSGSPLFYIGGNDVFVAGVQGGSHVRRFISKRTKKIRRSEHFYNYAISVNAFRHQLDIMSVGQKPPGRSLIGRVQDGLISTGDLVGVSDGLFGNKTRQAIIDFQRRHKIVVTGWPDFNLLDEIQRRPIPAPPKKTVPRLERYLYSPSYKSFKAFAVDQNTGISGIAYGQKSAAAAINQSKMRCYLIGGNCSLYAVGDHIVFGMPLEEQERIAKEHEGRVRDSQ